MIHTVYDKMHLNYTMNRTMVVFFGSFYFYYVSIQCEAMTMCPRPMYPRTKVLGRCNPHCTENPDLCIPRNETALPRSQFLHSCICERFIYSRDRSAYLAEAKISTEKLGNRLVRGEGDTPMAPTPFSSLLDK